MTLAFVFPDCLEECYGYETPRAGDQWIASLVPIFVVLPADDVKEIALGEA